ncbi:protein-glutamate O-methyltransferase CheR [Maridesulfovibrio sp.]|uniref:CheR family methyltransferase n=1 Tax=Maridesulfovibrio sp. TaxID=2795000 RepID=UPI002A18E24B|nr:protein-glutamate O-methyltransferase CheR [Maridesulfovibrio sp.]
MKIGRQEFDLLRGQIYSLCGLIIPDGKEYLIEHRLQSLFQSSGCGSWQDFYKLMCCGDKAFLDEVISAVSTNETSFFRDTHPFNSIRNKILPPLVRARRSGRKIRIWCAASSTGQEPYSLAMLIHEFCRSTNGLKPDAGDFSILATDISSRVLEKATAGRFSEMELSRGLPDRFRKYFKQHHRSWVLDDEIRTLVSFRKFNLLDSFKTLGKFDFVMCRNVLIYFDDKTKIDVVHRIHSLLPEQGYLMLGGTETLAGYTDRFVAERSGPVIVYRKNE